MSSQVRIIILCYKRWGNVNLMVKALHKYYPITVINNLAGHTYSNENAEVINNDSNLIFNFDKCIDIKHITNNFIEILNEIENNDSVILNFSDLYYYPTCELLIIISGLFSKIQVYYSKLLKQNL